MSPLAMGMSLGSPPRQKQIANDLRNLGAVMSLGRV